MKMTFKNYLMEVDVGDLALAKTSKGRRSYGTDTRHDVNAEKKKNTFKNDMNKSSPNVRDVIVDEQGKSFIVQAMNMDGILGKAPAGGVEKTFAHGTKFQPAGRSEGGKPVFKVV